jgi:purine-nucleoside phosphorylase
MKDPTAFARFVDAARAQPAYAAVVLGSGLASVAKRVAPIESIGFGELPGFARSSVAGHNGRLILGCLLGRTLLVFEGRLHYYENHSWESVLAPVRLAARLGVKHLFLLNAAGGIHEALTPGSVIAITDHIEWTRRYCWRNLDATARGTTSSPYSPRLLSCLARAARDIDLVLHLGKYGAVTGPSYETPAEIRALKRWGADAVGMSTAREISTAHELGLECAALSCITNRAAGLSGKRLNHEEVLQTAAAQAEHLGNLLERTIAII